MSGRADPTSPHDPGDRPAPRPDLSGYVLGLCHEAGFDRAGIASPDPSAHAAALRAWLDAGKQGSMAWLGEHLHVRTDPGRLLRGSRAIVMVAARYAARGDVDPPTPEGHGRIARYARGRDYHRAMKKRLHAICDRLRAEFPGHECRAFADIEPMPERELAARAGIGWVGKHTLVIDPRHGSWLVLGGFATTLPLAPPAEQWVATDHCGTCTRCIDACPTGAITPYSVDASRCISYLTIERRLPIDPSLHEAIGDWLFGCDVCQEVCPHNAARAPRASAHATAQVRAGLPPQAASGAAVRDEIAGDRGTLPLLEVLGWSADDRSRILMGSVIKRATLRTLKRNAITVLGYWLERRPDPQIRTRLEAMAADPSEDPLLREAAQSSLVRVDGKRVVE